MDTETLKQMYGDEYPVAVSLDGVHFQLHQEDRFQRFYRSVDGTIFFASRFLDGSARFSFEELQREWPEWDAADRLDFLQAAASGISGQADWPDMLRYIIAHGSPGDWSMVALQVAVQLPQNEAFALLAACLEKCGGYSSSNLTQAIAHTKHPETEKILKSCLEEIWGAPKLWEDDSFVNWVAYDATTCIEHLISLGVPPEEFDERVRALVEHPCVGNQDSCRRYLWKYFAWMEPPPDGVFLGRGPIPES